MTIGWNYADVWEAVAERFADEPAFLHGDRTITWQELDRRADGVAAALLDAGLQRQDKVAQYMRNRPEYLESMFATFKAGVVPVNTNFRYGDDELRYLWDNSDAVAVVFDAEFTDVCERLRPTLARIRSWLRVGDGASCPTWATSYEHAADTSTERVMPPWGRSGDDLYMLYTGGTTGRPKGVMWRQDDLLRMLEAERPRPMTDAADITEFVAGLTRRGPRVLPAPPLMHGTACWFCLPVMSRGGSIIVTLTSASLDVVEMLDTIVAADVRGVCIVGDAFAKPLLTALEADPMRWDLTGLRVVQSSGAMLSSESKQRLLRFAPNAVILDALGSSEAGSLASTQTSEGSDSGTALFTLSPNTRVIDEDGRDVVPGSGQQGRLAVGGNLPLGYYGDPVKTAETFVTIGDKRFVVPGDWAEVALDGTITLLGRGSSCINTAGEKVYPEEVEEVLKTAAGVRDAAVVGLPDERFGERVVALVEGDGVGPVDEAVLIAHVKQHLAAYKAPRRVVVVASLGRGPNGKLDHKHLKAVALDATAAGSG